MRTSSIGVVIVFVSVLGAAAGCGETDEGEEYVLPREVSTVAQGIKDGDRDSTHTANVGLVIDRGGDTGLCSGTLIAPYLVLTARHCVATLNSQTVTCGQTEFRDQFPAGNVTVTTATDISSASGGISVDRIDAPSDPGICGNDIALLTLSQKIPTSTAKPYKPQIDSAPQIGDEYAAIGYGKSGQGAGTRRIKRGQEVQSSLQGREFVGEEGPCQGDSGGGPVDLDNRIVMGALSRGEPPCGRTIYSSTYGWRDFLRKVAKRSASNNSSYSPPSWLTSCQADADCQDGDVCINGTCQTPPCESDADCDGGAVCEVSSGDCVGCLEDADCSGEASLCDTSNQRCIECRADDDCAGDQWCGRDGTCIEPLEECPVCDTCSEDPDCGPGHDEGRVGCLESVGRCSMICRPDGSCPGESTCFRIETDRQVIPICLNPGFDGEASSVCPDSFTCTIPDDPDEGDDTGAGSSGPDAGIGGPDAGALADTGPEGSSASASVACRALGASCDPSSANCGGGADGCIEVGASGPICSCHCTSDEECGPGAACEKRGETGWCIPQEMDRSRGDTCSGPSCGSTTSADAGAASQATKITGRGQIGCGCRQPTGAPASLPVGVLMVIVVGGWSRMRRRRRRFGNESMG